MRITGNLALFGSALLVASSAAMAIDSFPGIGTGAIPDAPAGGPACGTSNLGSARVVSFEVSGITVPVVAVSLSMTLVHPYRGDLVVRLNAPGGSPSKIVFSHTASNNPDGCGHDGDLNGAYVFADTAILNWWGSAFPVVPPGTYRASTPGGVDPGGEPVQLSFEFRNLPTTASNGTWTLSIQDAGDGDTGSINAATLMIDQTDVIFANGFQTVTP